MLQRLFIENVALIERLDIEFHAGFNVLSGETGAGKSIIIDAVNFVLGERASRELIRHGAQKTKVEAVFDIADCGGTKAVLAEQGIDCEDDTLFLSRELSLAGKNLCRVNGILTSVTILKAVSDTLVDIHGQHEHQSLLAPENHIAFLDAYAHAEILPIRDELNRIYGEFAALRRERLSGFGSVAERERQIDILKYQINEIGATGIETDEEDALQAEKTLLVNAERIMLAVETAYEQLNGEGSSATAAVDAARHNMESISGYAKEYAEAAQKLADAYYALEDVGYALRDMKGGLEFDPQRLDQIEMRLETLSDLKRKYGGTIAEVFAFEQEAQEKLDALLQADARAAKLDEKLAEAKKRYFSLAQRLTALREAAAERLSGDVLSQLRALGMEKAAFRVAFAAPQDNGEPQENGMDALEFLLSANPGEPLKPLAKVASGGELSRIMLGFKAIFADNDRIGTLIFDEIDTGISGRIAGTVGEKMVGIAGAHQVICVTHLPQIAALADVHYLVEKTDDGMATHVAVRLLDLDGKYRRIAQMMDGSSDSPLALEHAKTLVDKAEKAKKIRRGN